MVLLRRELAARNDSPVHVVSVPTRTLAAVVAEHGPAYYVKIDIEGHDAIALRSRLEVEPRPRYVSVENGNQGMPVAADYNAFKYIQQRGISETRVTRPAREGDYAGHLFPRGASGPFGEETPGAWLDAGQAREQIGRIWDDDGSGRLPAQDERTCGWFDLHARHRDAGTPAGDG